MDIARASLVVAFASLLGCSTSNDDATTAAPDASLDSPAPVAAPVDAGADANDAGAVTALADASDETCGCHGKAGCAVWSDVYISWYGFNDNSCTKESVHGCNDIAYAAPLATRGEHGMPYPNAGTIKHTEATEGTGTYDDPITAAASADSDPEKPTGANPRHAFASAKGVTLTPGTLIYNPEVQKYFIMEDSCIECGDEFACVVSPEDTDDGKVPAGCVPGTNLHIDFWMGPEIASDTDDLDTCQASSTLGDDWKGGPGQVIVNPPSDLPVVTTPLYTGSGAHGGCWTAAQASPVSCP